MVMEIEAEEGVPPRREVEAEKERRTAGEGGRRKRSDGDVYISHAATPYHNIIYNVQVGKSNPVDVQAVSNEYVVNWLLTS